jgi:hypothetical protein
MKREGKLMRGMLLGAGAMYFLDPDRGARRRSLLRDQLVHAGHKIGDGVSATARDTRNRAKGVAAELRSRLRTLSDRPGRLSPWLDLGDGVSGRGHAERPSPRQ